MDKKWTDYFDSLGLLRNGDSGDALRETATYLCAFNQMSQKSLIWNSIIKCHVNGLWVRHPNPTDAWHKDPKEFSRDQWTALMCAIIHMERSSASVDGHLRETLKDQFTHPFTAQNGDIITYEWCLYIRAVKLPFSLPLLVFLDMGLFINVCIRIVKSWIRPLDTADDINVTTMLHTFLKYSPTPFVWLSKILYKLRRRGVLYAWQMYYQRPEAPPMAELWEPIIQDLHLN